MCSTHVLATRSGKQIACQTCSRKLRIQKRIEKTLNKHTHTQQPIENEPSQCDLLEQLRLTPDKMEAPCRDVCEFFEANFELLSHTIPTPKNTFSLPELEMPSLVNTPSNDDAPPLVPERVWSDESFKLLMQ